MASTRHAQPPATQARDDATMATSLRDVVERMWSLPPGWQELLLDAFGGLPHLPPDWQVKVSREHGLPYYANKELRCTQWHHPGLPEDAPIPPEVSGLKRVWRQLRDEREQRAAAEVAQRQAAADAARRAILDRLQDLLGPTALYAKVRHVQAILRGFLQRRKYQRQRRAALILQATVRHFLLSGNGRHIQFVPIVQATRVPGSFVRLGRFLGRPCMY